MLTSNHLRSAKELSTDQVEVESSNLELVLSLSRQIRRRWFSAYMIVDSSKIGDKRLMNRLLNSRSRDLRIDRRIPSKTILPF